jgi:hypothetical protein
MVSFDEYVKKYVKKIKSNECHFEKLSTEKLIELTKSMTSICFLGRPECRRCPLKHDDLYCPPSAAHKVLTERGYEKVTFFEGISIKNEYRMNTLMPMEITAVI